MPSVLYVNGRKVEVDMMFVDAGAPAVFGMMGGQKIVMEPAREPRLTIFMREGAFFTPDMAPVSDPGLVDWLPEPFRGKALAFAARQQEGGKKAALTPNQRPEAIRKVKAKPKRRRIHFDPKLAMGDLADQPIAPTAPLPQM